MAPSSASRGWSVASPTESTQRPDGQVPVRAAAGPDMDAHTEAEGRPGPSAECVNRNIFWSLAQARVVIAGWKEDHNHRRRHSALDYQAPGQYAIKCITGETDRLRPIRRESPGIAPADQGAACTARRTGGRRVCRSDG